MRTRPRLFCAALTLFAVSSLMAGDALRLVETRSANHPSGMGAATFAELIRERTDGAMAVDTAPVSAGGERAALDAVRAGKAVFAVANANLLGERTPILGVLSLPYLYRDDAHVRSVFDGAIGGDLLHELREQDLVGLALYDTGARSFYNGTRAVASPNHMRGLRFAVDGSQTMMGLVSALGAHATAMEYEAIRPGLLMGIIDGAESTWDAFHTSSHWELAPYYTLDRHTRIPDVLVVSRIVWDALDDEERAVITAAALDSVAAQREALENFEAASRRAVLGEGRVAVIDIANPEEWRELVRPLYANIELGPKRDDYLARIDAEGEE